MGPPSASAAVDRQRDPGGPRRGGSIDLRKVFRGQPGLRSRASASLGRCRKTKGKGNTKGSRSRPPGADHRRKCLMKYETFLERTSSSAPANPLRVLMVYWDGGGNLPPQRALARELTRRGHDV